MLRARPDGRQGRVERGMALKRKSFRLVLVAAMILTGAGLVAPSALASLTAPSTVAAVPFRADDDQDSDERPRIEGREHDNHMGLDNGKGCFYPPTNRPRINLYDPNRKIQAPTTLRLVGKATVAKCGITGLSLTLFSSRNGGQQNWTQVGLPVTTAANGNFTFTGVPFERTTFYKVVSAEQYGFAASTSNIVKIEKK